jgi:hypothetical protein
VFLEEERLEVPALGRVFPQMEEFQIRQALAARPWAEHRLRRRETMEREAVDQPLRQVPTISHLSDGLDRLRETS